MNPPPTLHRIATQVSTLRPETLRRCELIRIRGQRGWLTIDEQTELGKLERAEQLREEQQRAADEAAEKHTEGRTFRRDHPNPHGA